MEAFLADSNKLMDALSEKAAFLCSRSDLYERNSDEDHTYYGYVKSFLVHDAILCKEIMTAIEKEDLVLLSISAARVTVEDLINIQYLATHQNLNDRIKIAVDWLKRSNDPKLWVNKLDEKSLAERAKFAGDHILAIYENEYAMLCYYIHGGAQRVFLNMNQYRDLAAKKSVYVCLLAFSNIVFAVSALLGLPNQYNAELEKKVTNFLKKYRKSIAEAIR